MIDPNFYLLIIPLGFTYDDDGRVLGFRDKRGYWYVHTYDHNGRELTYRDETGFWYVYTRDDDGRELTYRDSDGCRDDYTYDVAGKCTITYTQEVPDAA